MKTKKIGIFMDHSNANLIEFPQNENDLNSITSDFSHFEKEKSLSKREISMHNKEQQDLNNYFKKIEEVLKNYTDVLLFGPTEAKKEFYNHLKQDSQFDNTKIEVENCDKLSSNQQVLFVNTHYQN